MTGESLKNERKAREMGQHNKQAQTRHEMTPEKRVIFGVFLGVQKGVKKWPFLRPQKHARAVLMSLKFVVHEQIL